MILGAVLLFLAAVVLWGVWENQALVLTSYMVSHKDLPSAFSGYKIAQVSDLHNVEMGKENERLLTMLENAKPDMIAITGDMIDSRRTDVEIALQFAQKAMKIAPCYYVPGNHESRLSKSDYQAFEDGLILLGVQVLHDREIIIKRAGEQISLVGINDPDFAKKYGGVATDMNPIKLAGLCSAETFTVLLSHRPEHFLNYAMADVDLVLTGHAHGGQIRLPWLGGLIAPHQGLFPKYDSGLFTEGNTNMIVSRGIGNSVFPLRYNNRPELILITLQNE